MKEKAKPQAAPAPESKDALVAQIDEALAKAEDGERVTVKSGAQTFVAWRHGENVYVENRGVGA